MGYNYYIKLLIIGSTIPTSFNILDEMFKVYTCRAITVSEAAFQMYLEVPFPRDAKNTLVRPHKNLTSTEIVDYSYLKGEELEKNDKAFHHFFSRS